MDKIESAVVRHYGRTELIEKILAGIEASKIDVDRLRPVDLAPIDEFHIGGRPATAYAVEKMGLHPEDRVIDIGCGIGGPARFIAAECGCRVAGIDLTPEYIAVAKELTALTGLADRVEYETGSALALPYADAAFDAAITIHVAMNITDRAGLYSEVARVIKPGGVFCSYDVMKKGAADLTFPLPWAESPETSHLTTPAEMEALLHDAGFETTGSDDRTEAALEFFNAGQAALSKGVPPLGPHLIIGASAPQKFKNVVVNIESGRIAPIVMIARRRAP